MDNQEKYIKGFNSGYILSKYEQPLMEKLASQSNNNIYFEGLIEGNRQYKKELVLQELKT